MPSLWFQMSMLACLVAYCALSSELFYHRATASLLKQMFASAGFSTTTKEQYQHPLQAPVQMPVQRQAQVQPPPLQVNSHPNTNTNTNTNLHTFVQDLPPFFRVCRVRNPAPQFGQPPLKAATSPLFQAIHMHFRYQCNGPAYNEFLQHYQFPLVLQRYHENPQLQWGQRPFVVPPTSHSTTTSDNQQRPRHIVIIGNSHTRQMVGSLLCQYHDQIRHVRNLQPHLNVHALQYQFHDNNTLVSVLMNHPFVFSQRWQSNLKAILRVDNLSSDIDAIVIGMHNTYDAKFHNSSLWQSVFQYAAQTPRHQVDPLHHKRGFPLRQLVHAYPGPIVWVSMLARYNQPIHERHVSLLHNITRQEHRTNLRTVNARQYIAAMADRECSSNQGTVVADCITNTSDVNYRDGHRCMGPLGGQPDLVAWDVTEALWDVLS